MSLPLDNLRAGNLRGGWALIRATWLSWLQHRGFFYLVAFSWMVPLLVYLLVWSTAAGEKPGKPLHQVKGLKVVFLAASSARGT